MCVCVYVCLLLTFPILRDFSGVVENALGGGGLASVRRGRGGAVSSNTFTIKFS